MFISSPTLQEIVPRQSWLACVSYGCIGSIVYGSYHISEELFYQLGLRQFGNFNRIRLEPPPSLRKLVSLAVDVEETINESSMDRNLIVEVLCVIFILCLSH